MTVIATQHIEADEFQRMTYQACNIRQRKRLSLIRDQRHHAVSSCALVTAAVLLTMGSEAAQSKSESSKSKSAQSSLDKPSSAKKKIIPLPTILVAPVKAIIAKPPPDVWSPSEIEDAKRVCRNALKTMHAVIEELPPIKKGRCGNPAPVRLVSIGKKHPVLFKPAPKVSCKMLAPLRRWIDRSLQPMAERHLQTRVASVRIMSSYSCRTRYGRKGARMSEHAFANALDIGGFRLADKRKVTVLAHWGPTKRDIAKAVAAQKAKDSQSQPTAAIEGANAGQKRIRKTESRRSKTWTKNTKVRLPEVLIRSPKSSAIGKDRSSVARVPPLKQRTAPQPSQRVKPSKALRQPATIRLLKPPRQVATRDALPPLPTRRPLRQAVRHRVSLDQSDRKRPQQQQRSPVPSPRKLKAPYRLGGPVAQDKTPRAIFLRGIHQAACRIFGTTLGPEANEAHRNHFHFDMYPRRRRGYCE